MKEILLLAVVLLAGCVPLALMNDREDTQKVPAVPPAYGYPSIQTSLSPSNPALGETVTLTITAEAAQGLQRISWLSSRPFEEGFAGAFDCQLEPDCTQSWDVVTMQAGQHDIVVTITDAAGQQSTGAPMQLMVQERRVSTTFCGDGVCASGESCPEDCVTCGDGVCAAGEACPEDCEIPVEDECTSNSDCGYKERCASGTCVSVECTTDSQCSGCRRCSGNSCVSCGSGPYGCYC